MTTARELILRISPGMPLDDELQRVIAVEATRFLCSQESLPATIQPEDASAFMRWHDAIWKPMYDE